MLIQTTTESLELDPDWLLVAIDETGHELLADKAYPIFGLGGVAVRVSDYDEVIRQPWESLRAEHFAGQPLHAADLRKPTAEQQSAIGRFFESQPFGRMASVLCDRSVLSDGMAAYQIVARSLLERVVRLVKRFKATGVVMIFEESSRADNLAAQYFSGYRLQLTEGVQSVELPMHHFRMAKALEPFMEVSDFVVYAAGTQVRIRRANGAPAGRRDFRSIFLTGDPSLAEFFEITSARFD